MKNKCIDLQEVSQRLRIISDMPGKHCKEQKVVATYMMLGQIV